MLRDQAHNLSAVPAGPSMACARRAPLVLVLLLLNAVHVRSDVVLGAQRRVRLGLWQHNLAALLRTHARTHAHTHAHTHTRNERLQTPP